MRRFILLVGVAAIGVSAVLAGEERSVKFTDCDGRVHTPLSQPERKATVLFFLLPDCPISNAYAPEIKRICDDYSKKEVAAFIVYVDADLSAEEARKHAAEYGYDCPVLRDTSHALVKLTGVTVAPEAVVLGPDGRQRYRGRIDDLYAEIGKRRAQPTERDLRDALDAVLMDLPVPNETTKAIGCILPKM